MAPDERATAQRSRVGTNLLVNVTANCYCRYSDRHASFTAPSSHSRNFGSDLSASFSKGTSHSQASPMSSLNSAGSALCPVAFSKAPQRRIHRVLQKCVRSAPMRSVGESKGFSSFRVFSNSISRFRPQQPSHRQNEWRGDGLRVGVQPKPLGLHAACCLRAGQ